jgi:NADH-quinone oxidoreductase subunit N
MLWVVIVAIVMAIVGAYYYLRVIKVMYFDVADDKSALALPSDLPFRWLLSLNGAALLVLGLFWGPLIAWCYRAFGIS